MIYCNQPKSVVLCTLSVVCRQHLLSETTRPRALIVDMKHCPVNHYQVYSVGGPRITNYPAAGGLGFENEICLTRKEMCP